MRESIPVLWGGLLHSSLTPTPPIHLQLGWEPIAVLWGGSLHSSLTPTPIIHLQTGWEPIAVIWGGLVQTVKSPKWLSGKISPRAVLKVLRLTLGQVWSLPRKQGCSEGNPKEQPQETARGNFFPANPSGLFNVFQNFNYPYKRPQHMETVNLV
mgnify:CR=1 FL=1